MSISYVAHRGEIVFFSIGRILVGECVDGVIQQVFSSPLSNAQQLLLTQTVTQGRQQALTHHDVSVYLPKFQRGYFPAELGASSLLTSIFGSNWMLAHALQPTVFR
jgi:hypothetical protein